MSCCISWPLNKGGNASRWLPLAILLQANWTAHTYVYSSKDKGHTWRHVSTVLDQYWSKLFVLNNTVYLLGTSSCGAWNATANIAISSSADNGESWQQSTLFSVPHGSAGHYHGSATPVAVHNGHIWHAFEFSRHPSRYNCHICTAMILNPQQYCR